MKVFLTGATGLVGSNLIPALVAAGHSVTALTRSESKTEQLQQLGATRVVVGALDNLDILENEAQAADIVIHMGFDHDLAFKPEGYAKACAGDRDAVTAMCDGLVKSQASGGQKIFIGASGTFSRLGPEETSPISRNPQFPRYLTDELIQSYSDKGLRTAMAMLPPVVHAPDRIHPFISGQIDAAKKNGFAAYIGEGSNVWCSTHVKDVASLIVAALESDKFPSGSYLHPVAESGIPTKDIAAYLAKRLGVEARSITAEEAMKDIGFVGRVMTLGIRINSDLTRQWTGWEPREYGLFEELDKASF